MARCLITSNAELQRRFHDLRSGDVVVGRIRMRTGEEHLLLDLAARGVRLIPSALSQWLSRSKVLQARILAPYMVPGTRPVYDQHDLMETVTEYGRNGVGRVVCKLDRANGGLGILLFASVEEVYAQAMLGALRPPFVLQPFVDQARDIRVVFLGDHLEAYQRHNPHNFRHNLHCGGEGSPWQMDSSQLELCRAVMARGEFPYAHIDLLLTPDGENWLNEINLRGGLRGARISQSDYLVAVERVHAGLLKAEGVELSG
ncbi:MAG: ATP-grasp domain-containing protein [Thermodesulfobacteriota bacterium]